MATVEARWENMRRLNKPKVLMKCSCGQTVSVGSVFCSCCKAKVQKENAKTIKKKEKKYQKMMRDKARGR